MCDQSTAIVFRNESNRPVDSNNHSDLVSAKSFQAFCFANNVHMAPAELSYPKGNLQAPRIGSALNLNIGKTLRSRIAFLINRPRERLWVRPLAFCILSLGGVLLAKAPDLYGLGPSVPVINPDSIEALLSIVAASMLVIATFAVGSMVSAYASATGNATPRSFPLVVADDVSQNAPCRRIYFQSDRASGFEERVLRAGGALKAWQHEGHDWSIAGTVAGGLSVAGFDKKYNKCYCLQILRQKFLTIV